MTDPIRIVDLRALAEQMHAYPRGTRAEVWLGGESLLALIDVAEAANAYLDATDAHDQAIAIKGVFGEQLEDRTTETEQTRGAAYERLDRALARIDLGATGSACCGDEDWRL